MDPSPPPPQRRESLVSSEQSARELAGELGGAMNAVILEPLVADAVEGIRFTLLAVVMVPIGIVVLILSFFVYFGAFLALGSPTGSLGAIVTGVWLIGTLVALVVVYRAVSRRMLGRGRLLGARPAPPKAAFAGGALSELLGGEPQAAVAAIAPAPSLAELDARLAPMSPPTSAPTVPPTAAGATPSQQDAPV
ncbi:MAG TPA: hypothetical protein VIF63_09800 [Candidatus Limnocylindrales bacterium]